MPKIKQLAFPFLVSFSIALSSCHAQSPSIGEVVDKLDNSIWIVYQDTKMNYWFGSDGKGVYRYDGKHITNFTTKQGLANDRVRQIQEDKAGNIFINTLTGITVFDGKSFKTLPEIETDSTDLTHWQLHDDDLWFTGRQDQNGAYRYDGKSLYHLKFPKHFLEDDFYKRVPNPPYNPYEVYRIYRDSKGNIWLGTSTFGVCRFDGKNLSWLYEDHLTHIGENGSFGIRAITEDKDSNFWFSNTRYKYRIREGDSIHNGTRYIKYDRLPGMNLGKIYHDTVLYYLMMIKTRNHDLWMVTYNDGVWRVDDENIEHYPIWDDKDRKPITTYSLYEDRYGKIWLGTHEGGVYRLAGQRFFRFWPNIEGEKGDLR